MQDYQMEFTNIEKVKEGRMNDQDLEIEFLREQLVLLKAQFNVAQVELSEVKIHRQMLKDCLITITSNENSGKYEWCKKVLEKIK